jgi:hypothetical protein
MILGCLMMEIRSFSMGGLIYQVQFWICEHFIQFGGIAVAIDRKEHDFRSRLRKSCSFPFTLLNLSTDIHILGCNKSRPTVQILNELIPQTFIS